MIGTDHGESFTARTTHAALLVVASPPAPQLCSSGGVGDHVSTLAHEPIGSLLFFAWT